MEGWTCHEDVAEHWPPHSRCGFGLVKTDFLCHVTSAQFVGDVVNPRFVNEWLAEPWCCHVGPYLLDVCVVEATGQDLFDIFKEWMMWPHSACTTDAVFFECPSQYTCHEYLSSMPQRLQTAPNISLQGPRGPAAAYFTGGAFFTRARDGTV